MMKLIRSKLELNLTATGWAEIGIRTQNNHGSFEPFAHGPQTVSREIVATASYSGDIDNVSVAAIAGGGSTARPLLGVPRSHIAVKKI